MKLTMVEKLNMCKEHVEDKKTISHVSERYGEKPFVDRKKGFTSETQNY